MEKVEKEAIWPGPEGMIPSLPKDASNASWHTRHFLDEILIEERIIGTREAEITMNLFGEKFASPIMMPAFSHLNKVGLSHKPMQEYAMAAKEMNMREIISVYGMTESAPGSTMGEVNEDEDHRVETVGSAFPGVECKIIDPETGEDLPDGENGEFVARGFNIMKGYYKMPEATAQTIDADGWLHSGDICCRTPDGYYKVTGRLKDMIIRGGENLYPREIEEFYLNHEKVRDVQVVGVPDDRYGEEACAWIVLHEGVTATEDEMREYGNSFMARHKVPRYFIFVKALPMNAAGKILKYKMREESIEILGLKK